MHLPTGQHVVILKEKTNDRYLPIWIGFEANAIALAVRFECLIFVAAEVLDRAGVIHEHDKGEEKVPEEKVDEGRLAVFRDLFNSLDLPDLPDEPGSRGRGSSSS